MPLVSVGLWESSELWTFGLKFHHSKAASSKLDWLPDFSAQLRGSYVFLPVDAMQQAMVKQTNLLQLVYELHNIPFAQACLQEEEVLLIAHVCIIFLPCMPHR